MRPRILAPRVGAIWMRAVANACGYTPQTAKPLALAYVLTRKGKHAELGFGTIEFAGLHFDEPDDGRVWVPDKIYTAADYEADIRGRFTDVHQHDKLFYRAVDTTEQWCIERMDTRSTVWDRFNHLVGGRRSISFANALEIFDSLTP